MPEETLVKQSFDMLSRCGPDKSQWLGTVRLLISVLGLECHFHNVNLVNTRRFSSIVSGSPFIVCVCVI